MECKYLLTEFDTKLEDLKDLIESKVSQSEISNITNEDIVMLIGNTNSGKSTLLNYLIGCDLEEIEESEEEENDDNRKEHYGIKIRVTPSSLIKELAKIGNSMISETQFIKSIKTNDFILADTQGICDNRSQNNFIAFQYLLLDVLKSCRSVKFIVVISHDELVATKGKNADELLTYIQEIFSGYENLQKFKNSFLICITKNNDYSEIKYRKEFSRSKNPIKNLLADRIVMYNPFNENKKKVTSLDDFIIRIKKSESVQEKIFKMSFRVEEINYATEMIMKLKEIINDDLKNKDYDNLKTHYVYLTSFEKMTVVFTIKNKFNLATFSIKDKMLIFSELFTNYCTFNEFEKAEKILNKIKILLNIDQRFSQQTISDYEAIFEAQRNEEIELKKNANF